MLIEISSLKKSYTMGETVVPALRGVSLKIAAGEFVAIMGPSGSGKSTLMHLLGLLDVPDSGSYLLSGKEISRLRENELAALRANMIGFVFQQFNLLARTSALENVGLPLIYTRLGDRDRKPKMLLEQVGLAGRIHHKPSELSGGQQQRVAIARAMVNDPKIIFADEPTGNLDSKSQGEIMEIFKNLNDQGMTVILVTHEEEVASFAKRIIKMRDGMILSDDLHESEKRIGGTAVATGVRAKTGESITVRSETPAYSIFEAREHFKQAWRSLSANKVRTGLSMLGILIGVGAVIAMLALGTGARKSIEQQLSSLGTNLLVLRPGSRRAGGIFMESGAGTRILEQDGDKILAEVPAVKRISPTVQGRGQIVYGGNNWNTQILGSAPQYAEMRSYTPVAGRFFTAEENLKRARVAVIGQTLVRELFAGANPVGEMIKINKINFQVIGILPEKGATGWRDQDDMIIIPLRTAMRRVLGKEFVDSIDIEVERADAMDEVQDKVKDLIIREHRIPPSQQDTVDVRNMADIQAALFETNRTMTWLLGSIAAVSLLVGGIGIMNIMLVSVTERTREIGLRKAIGAKRFDILSQFLIEAVMVSGAGGVLGILLGSGISYALSKFAGWTTDVSLRSILSATFFSMAVGIAFGFWPAQKAAKLNPIDALRYE